MRQPIRILVVAVPAALLLCVRSAAATGKDGVPSSTLSFDRDGSVSIFAREASAYDHEYSHHTTSGASTDVPEEDLLAWATRHPFTEQPPDEQPAARAGASVTLPQNTQLLIGVKSAVRSGFPARQLLRQTWADRTRLPPSMSVLFLGCEPDLKALDPDQQRAWRQALDVEKATYGDLLTHELACEDSYWSLVEKVKGFLRWTSRMTLPELAYVMLADDDVYIRVDKLFDALIVRSLVPRQGFYGGQVLASQHRTDIPVGRCPHHKNMVPVEEYPMSHKPAFATGAHYLLSVDLVRFLSRNHGFLKGVGALEDVSVAYWLLALLHIQPVYIYDFENVRFELCHNSLISYADLKPAAIRQLHSNLRQNRSFCDGVSFSQADKRTVGMTLPDIELSGPLRMVQPLEQRWEVQFNVSVNTLHVTLTVSTPGNESLSVFFKPAQSNFAAVCMSLREGVVELLPRTALSSDICKDLHAMLFHLLHEEDMKAPASSHMLALARHNLLHGMSSAAVGVRLSSRILHMRLLVECLFTAAFPDAHVDVHDESESASTHPSIVVASASDLLHAGDRFEMPPLTRLVVISDKIDPLEVVFPQPALLVSSTQPSPEQRDSQLYLPLASSSFANRRSHSPRALLNALDTPNGSVPRTSIGFCVCNSATSPESHQQLAILTTTFSDQGLAARPQRCEEASLHQPFHHDLDVQRCQQLKFAIVFEDHPDIPGYISHQIVSAFLAGSIPIYYGHSATASWLFNPRAFIDCRSFVSMEACALEVARVDGSEELYVSMRGEAAVVNVTAFWEVFSWHPDAFSVGAKAGINKATMGERFRHLLLRV